MSGSATTVSVYVLALGRKFLGSKVGFAKVTIAGGPSVISGTANMRYSPARMAPASSG